MPEPMKHKLTEVVEGQQPEGVNQEQQGPPTPGTTPQEVAEETRREQQARSHGRPDRDDYLVTVGRGHQTHG
jgi:hypothetical protein